MAEFQFKIEAVTKESRRDNITGDMTWGVLNKDPVIGERWINVHTPNRPSKGAIIRGDLTQGDWKGKPIWDLLPLQSAQLPPQPKPEPKPEPIPQPTQPPVADFPPVYPERMTWAQFERTYRAAHTMINDLEPDTLSSGVENPAIVDRSACRATMLNTIVIALTSTNSRGIEPAPEAPQEQGLPLKPPF
jgi:hypothetical protein